MNGNGGLSVCSTGQLPLAIHATEKGYIASAPDSLGRCGRPADRDVKVDRLGPARDGATRLLPFLWAAMNNDVNTVNVTNSDATNASFIYSFVISHFSR